jgi:hypothetical protein
MAGKHRRPVRTALAEGVLYLALGILALVCVFSIVIALGGGRT